jgi:hypothetical protein
MRIYERPYPPNFTAYQQDWELRKPMHNTRTACADARYAQQLYFKLTMVFLKLMLPMGICTVPSIPLRVKSDDITHNARTPQREELMDCIASKTTRRTRVPAGCA